MYQISFSPGVLNTLNQAAYFYHQIRCGGRSAWDGFSSEELTLVREQWGRLQPVEMGAPLVVSNCLTGVQLRSLTRALTAYVAAHDGRYSLLVDYMSTALSRHPDPFALAFALAEAEGSRKISGQHVLMPGLNKQDDADVRSLLTGITQAMTPSGQAVDLDLPDLGIVKAKPSAFEPT